jgi:hypothetical protein
MNPYDNNVDEQWSDELIELTKRSLYEKEFGSRDGKVYFKHIQHGSGYFMSVSNALIGKWLIHNIENQDGKFEYGSIVETVNGGWALD